MPIAKDRWGLPLVVVNTFLMVRLLCYSFLLQSHHARQEIVTVILEMNRQCFNINFPSSVFFRECLVMDYFYFGVWDWSCSNIQLSCCCLILSNVASYSREMSESLYIAAVSPLRKITFPEELNLIIKHYLRHLFCTPTSL